MMVIAIILSLVMAQDGECPGTCPNPAGMMHPQSLDHTHGGSCRACSKAIDQCFVLCDDHAQGVCIVCGGKTGRDVKVERTWSGGDSKIEKPEVLRITDGKSWDELWNRHAGQKAPQVDFERSMVIAIFRGKILPTAKTELVGVREFEGRVELTVRWTHARFGNEPAKIADYLFVKLPRSKKRLRIVSIEKSPPKCIVHELLAEFQPLE